MLIPFIKAILATGVFVILYAVMSFTRPRNAMVILHVNGKLGLLRLLIFLYIYFFFGIDRFFYSLWNKFF